MLRIVFKDCEVTCYSEEEYDDYTYDGKCFIVTLGKRWIGIYNMDCIACIEYYKDEDICNNCDECCNTCSESCDNDSKKDDTKKVRVYVVEH